MDDETKVLYARQAAFADLAASMKRLRQQCLEKYKDGIQYEVAVGFFDEYIPEIERLSTLPPTHTVVPVDWLREAADDVADWGVYASDYFQQKHDYDGTVNKWKQRYEAARKP